MSEEQSEGVCRALAPGDVRFDIETRDPKLVIHRSFGREEACLSLVKGELSRYLEAFGPAEVHAEPATLLPSLFRIHGSPYFHLPRHQTESYRRRLLAKRGDRKQLQCGAYRANVLRIPSRAGSPERRLYEVELSCRGTGHYALQIENIRGVGYKIRKMSLTR